VEVGLVQLVQQPVEAADPFQSPMPAVMPQVRQRKAAVSIQPRLSFDLRN
jgi:hypothetical protein